MSPVLTIGLPELTESDIEQLAEECEEEISRFVLKSVPRKSISELSVICVLDVSSDGSQLDVDVQLSLEQEYETGHSLETLAEEATKHAVNWLEKKLTEMKGI
ncbi:MAG: hypothetical protein C4K49_11175 [Candidatus Thorarchaeota archaeon]|nr:MAG: hypothetical protein C4K49_11175 [Candidatus Thorarchaeota archaeon]